jgi:hypothetical protein
MFVRHKWLAVIIATMMISGCAHKQFVPAPESPALDSGWSARKISKDELNRLAQAHVDLDYRSSLEILARLNVRDRDYIEEDIKKGKSLKVPNDFRYFKNWTPLPKRIPEVDHISKFVLVVKSLPFLGWYEKGHLVEDSYVCIGKKGEWTKAGLYQVLKKDENHVSASYRNAFDQPALMPWALRIYGHVWIHAGDIEGPNCSHGCINLPLKPAQKLFSWTDPQTTVLVIENLKDLQKTLPKQPVKQAPTKPAAAKPAPNKNKSAPVKPPPEKAAPAKAA